MKMVPGKEFKEELYNRVTERQKGRHLKYALFSIFLRKQTED
jgi:hypothetical protein